MEEAGAIRIRSGEHSDEVRCSLVDRPTLGAWHRGSARSPSRLRTNPEPSLELFERASICYEDDEPQCLSVGCFNSIPQLHTPPREFTCLGLQLTKPRLSL